MRRLLTWTVPCLWAATGCVDPFTYVGTGGARSTSSSTVAAGGGGADGTGAGTSSSGTTSSTPPPKCDAGTIGVCGDGKYCSESSGDCEPCSDLSRLHFAAPVKITMAPTTAGTTAYYPRIGSDDGTLYFVYIDDSGALPRSRIASAAYKPSTKSWAAWILMNPPVASMGEESGPLHLPSGALLEGLVDTTSVDTHKPVLLFDSNRNGATTRKLFAANLDGSKASLVSLPSGKRDSDVAAAPLAHPPRFYWLSDGTTNMEQRLVTATASTSQMGAVKLALDTGCVVDAVAAPWVTLDGKLLLFGAYPPLAGTCAPSVPPVARLFAAHMTDQGQQVTGDQAQPLLPEDTQSFDSTPSLSPDACFLFFSRFDPMTSDGRPMLAVRD